MAKDVVSEIADEIVGKAAVASAAAASSFRADLMRRLNRLLRSNLTMGQILSEATRIIRRTVRSHTSVQTQILTDARIAGWVRSAKQIQDKLPKDVIEAVAAVTGPPGLPPMDLIYPPGKQPKVRFPKLEQSVRDLAGRKLVEASEFYAVADQAARNAMFTVSRFEIPTIRKIQGALEETLREGPSLREFNRRMREADIKSPLGPGHMENVYRTAVQSSFRAGREKVLAHPIVATAFPYRKRLPIRDSRLTELCEILSKSGIGGSAIYRSDDPVWTDMADTPSHFQCRCGAVPVTIKEAARQGVKSAQEWMDSGEDPRDYVQPPVLTEEAQKTWDSWRKWQPAA